MAEQLTFSTFRGYALSYEQLAQFYTTQQKKVPPREHLQGPTCILADFELEQAEREALAADPQVSVHERCVCIYIFPESDIPLLVASGLLWCANVADDFAYVALPDIITLLAQRSV